MSNVVLFPHIPTSSEGQRSGRNSLRGTPVAASIDRTNSAGTPFFDRVSQYQTCDCEVPIRSAKGFCPPTISHARFKAAVDIDSPYLILGEYQQKNLSGTRYRSFGSSSPMRKKVDKAALGARVASRRTKLEWSQAELAGRIGMSQQGVDNIEKGSSARPRLLKEMAEQLETTEDWLLWAIGPEVVRTEPTPEEIAARLQRLTPDQRRAALRYIKDLTSHAA